MKCYVLSTRISHDYYHILLHNSPHLSSIRQEILLTNFSNLFLDIREEGFYFISVCAQPSKKGWFKFYFHSPMLLSNKHHLTHLEITDFEITDFKANLAKVRLSTILTRNCCDEYDPHRLLEWMVDNVCLQHNTMSQCQTAKKSCTGLISLYRPTEHVAV